MIIIEGPDCTGKTALAKALSEQYGVPYYHFTKESTYLDYLRPLCNLNLVNAVVDRWIFSEYPYSKCMGRSFAFTLKEWHNIILLTLAHNPVVLLCTHLPKYENYHKDQYLPFDKWCQCLQLYREFFHNSSIGYIEYDYTDGLPLNPFNILEAKYIQGTSWWVPMWKAGYGYIGPQNPEFLLVAERIGPNNVNNLPFETGPTGIMLSDMLQQTGTPLGKFAVTNMVKSFRRDPRPPNERDKQLLRIELENLKPRVAVFMGGVSKQHGIKVAKEVGIKAVGMTHFGYYSHRGITDITPLCNQWAEIVGNKPIKEENAGEKGSRPTVSFTSTSL